MDPFLYTPVRWCSDRRNRTLMNMVRSMMCFTNLPISFWRYAQGTTAYILNKVPSKSIASTPYEIWKRRKSNLKHLKTWGCPTYVRNIFGYKLSARSDKYRFVGYLKKTNGYYFYHLLNKRCLLVGTSLF